MGPGRNGNARASARRPRLPAIVLTAWEARRPAAASVVNRLESPNLPTAGEYAVALHNAEMLVFASEKLLSLYAGIIYSMPIYRLYPATAEAEAIALWWPWGRSAPLVDGGPPRYSAAWPSSSTISSAPEPAKGGSGRKPAASSSGANRNWRRTSRRRRFGAGTSSARRWPTSRELTTSAAARFPGSG
jgi:hypothetical protein